MGRNRHSNPQQVVTLTQGQLKQICDIAADRAIEVFTAREKRLKSELRDKRLYNTRLLLHYYKGLVEYSKSAVYNTIQVEDDVMLEELLESIDRGKECRFFKVDSIQERVAKTRVIINHVNKMFEFYKFRCENSTKLDIARRWETVERMYLNEKEETAQDLAAEYCCDESTVYRYLNKALSDLSALLFGCGCFD